MESHQTLIDALKRVRHSDELETLALRISRVRVTDRHIEIAQALEDARKRIPYTESLPNIAFEQALDWLSQQREAGYQ